LPSVSLVVFFLVRSTSTDACIETKSLSQAMLNNTAMSLEARAFDL